MIKTGFVSSIAVFLTFGAGPAVAASPGQSAADGAVDLTLVTVITIAALVAAVVVGGIVISAIAAGVSRFLGKNMPPADVITKLDKEQIAWVSVPRKRIKLSPNWEPFVIAAAGFIVVYILAALFVRPASEAPAADAAAAPTSEAGAQTGAAGESRSATAGTLTSLPTSGDFEAIVGQLPVGDADSGAKLFASIGCNACHGLQKDQRLVGPSFYGLWTRSASNPAGLSAKAYLYQSIVQPNAVIVEGFQPNLMPLNYSTVLSVQQMADILAYIERDHAEK